MRSYLASLGLVVSVIGVPSPAAGQIRGADQPGRSAPRICPAAGEGTPITETTRPSDAT